MFTITETNCESHIVKASLVFLNHEDNSYSDFSSVCAANHVSEEEMKMVAIAKEYLMKEATTPLLLHKSHMQMLLTMGVRDCPEQAEVSTQVLESVKNYLDAWENTLSRVSFFSGSFGLVDIAVYCSTYNIFRYVMVPTWRDLYPMLTAWRCRCSAEPSLQATFTNTLLAATVREGGQIDVRPNPDFVATVAEMAIAKNQDFKKETSQRQKEKAASVASADVSVVDADAIGVIDTTVAVCDAEEAMNESEATIFAILNSMGIAHTTVQHEAAKTVDDVVRFVDVTRGLPTKNLFLKAKKANGSDDSGLWMVVAAYDSAVSINKLTSDLKYKSGSLRFADDALLKTVLGVESGHLSLFAKIHDQEKKVQVIIDKRLLETTTVSLHPLINTSSTYLSSKDFIAFAEKYAKGYKVMEF